MQNLKGSAEDKAKYAVAYFAFLIAFPIWVTSQKIGYLVCVRANTLYSSRIIPCICQSKFPIFADADSENT